MLNYFDNALRGRKEYYRALEPVCRRWDLTRNELDIILFLANNPTLNRASDIVTRRGIAKSHVSQSVSQLESRGILEARQDPNDRRITRLSLTAGTAELAAQAQTAQRAFFRQILKGLTQEDVMLWHNLMEKVWSNLETMENSSARNN